MGNSAGVKFHCVRLFQLRALMFQFELPSVFPVPPSARSWLPLKEPNTLDPMSSLVFLLHTAILQYPQPDYFYFEERILRFTPGGTAESTKRHWGETTSYLSDSESW